MKLKDWRDAKGLTQEAVAAELGYESREMVSLIERGLAFPSLSKLGRIRQLTGGEVTADDFLDGVEV